jgi:uncharacterized protein (DUF433 family)
VYHEERIMPQGRIVKWKRMKRLKIEDMAHLDPREVPMYWLSDVALFTGVPESTLKRWAGQISSSHRLIVPPPDEFQQRQSELRLSFANLLEAHILDATRKRDIPIARVRRGIEYLQKESPNTQHPLLAHTFYSVAGTRDVFIRTLEGEPLNVSRHGQRGLAAVLEEHLRRIEWDRTGPVRLMPMRSDRVVIDLNVSGGQPVVQGTGVLASILASRWRAGDSLEELARGYTLPLNDVREAVRYIDAAAA